MDGLDDVQARLSICEEEISGIKSQLRAMANRETVTIHKADSAEKRADGAERRADKAALLAEDVAIAIDKLIAWVNERTAVIVNHDKAVGRWVQPFLVTVVSLILGAVMTYLIKK